MDAVQLRIRFQHPAIGIRILRTILRKHPGNLVDKIDVCVFIFLRLEAYSINFVLHY